MTVQHTVTPVKKTTCRNTYRYEIFSCQAFVSRMIKMYKLSNRQI